MSHASKPTVANYREFKEYPKIVAAVSPILARQRLVVPVELFVEIKFRKRTGSEVIDEMKEKVARLKLPKGRSFRTVLIHAGELDPAVEAPDYFDFIIPADDLAVG